MNIEKALLRVLAEMKVWAQLNFDFPHYIAELILKKDDLRISKELVLTLVSVVVVIVVVVSVAT